MTFFPVVGVNARVRDFASVGAGAVLYALGDPNPTSARPDAMQAAAYLSVSFDGDVIAIFSQVFN